MHDIFAADTRWLEENEQSSSSSVAGSIDLLSTSSSSASGVSIPKAGVWKEIYCEEGFQPSWFARWPWIYLYDILADLA